jgi:hypothetical protein
MSRYEPGVVINHLGARVFSKIRRFVVIREGDSYCNALPINTYAGRGVAKHGIAKSEHAIIYTGRTPPRVRTDEAPKRGETGMQSIPIRVDADSFDELLDPMSRIDFGGVTKIQHNIRVKPLGIVNSTSMAALQHQFKVVWDTPTNITVEKGGDPRGDGQSKDCVKDDDSKEEDADEEDEDDDERDDDDDSPLSNNPPGRPESSHMQASKANATAMDLPAVIRTLGFTEVEIGAVINRVSQGQDRRQVIAVVARTRALNEGYSANIANQVATVMTSGPLYMPYHNALLQACQTIHEATIGRITENANDDDEDDDEDEEETDEESDDDDDLEERGGKGEERKKDKIEEGRKKGVGGEKEEHISDWTIAIRPEESEPNGRAARTK